MVKRFRVPEPYIPKLGARIMSLSDPLKKMSKSDDDPNGCVMLMDDDDTIQRKFKRAVTDSGTEINSIRRVLPLTTCWRSTISLLENPGRGGRTLCRQGYAQLKGHLADATIEFLKPIQQRVKEIT